MSCGGSLIRKEATGYGYAYMLEFVLKEHNQRLEGKSVAVSGAGNVAIHAIEKLVDKGAKVITVSDSSGVVDALKGLLKKDVNEISDSDAKTLIINGCEFFLEGANVLCAP